MGIYRVVGRQRERLLQKEQKAAAGRAVSILLATTLTCMGGLIVFDPTGHRWGQKVFDALWNAVNLVSTIGDFTTFNRAQQAFLMLTLCAFIVVGGYAIAALSDVLTGEEARTTRRNRTVLKSLEGLRHHAIVVGFGSVGQLVAELLKKAGEAVVVVDMDETAAARASGLGFLTVQGDASADDEPLERAGLQVARALYLTTDDPDRKLTITLRAHTTSPNLAICVTSPNEQRGTLLRRAGATEVVVTDPLIAQSIVSRLEARTSGESPRAPGQGVPI
jgi:voltage-gated potassium channel Kch